MLGAAEPPKKRRFQATRLHIYARIIILKSLRKWIENSELLVEQTDKSSRFAVMSVKQYMDTGRVHTHEDKLISWREIKYLQG